MNCCGDCRWWQGASVRIRSRWGACRIPIVVKIEPYPDSLPCVPRIQRSSMLRHDGQNCPCFEEGEYNP
jgi:hypothetical protein